MYMPNKLSHLDVIYGKCCYRCMKTIHDDRYQALIRQLVAEREQRSITQAVLVNALARPQSYIAKVENLERRLEIVELADCL